MIYGLNEETVHKIQMVLMQFKGIESAVLYGSRATGNYHSGSDIDISLKGDLTFEELLKIEICLDNLLLPYMIDLSLYDKLTDRTLLRHIDQMGKIVYDKGEGQSLINYSKNYRSGE